MVPEALTHLPCAGQPVVPWRNGGGTTREVAIEPVGGGTANFRWRVSIARIETDGPFSVFPGVDRTLWLLEGGGMELAIDGVPTHLTEQFASVAFPGEAILSARLLAGPTLDLNLMVDRTCGRAFAEVVRLQGGADHAWPAHASGTDLIVALVGELLALSPAGTSTTLAAGDALRLDHAHGARQWRLRASGSGAALLATLA